MTARPRRMPPRFPLVSALLGSMLALAGCTSIPQYPLSDHYDGERFFNVPREPQSASTWRIWWYFLTTERVGTVPVQPIPVQTLTWDTWRALTDTQVHVVRLGHSSLLLKLHTQQWMIDPVFSDRASPFSFAGPRRFHQVPIDVETLPELDGVLISHDHFDHLDAGTLKRIHPKVKRFVTALGVGARLRELGIPAEKITELDWHGSVQVGDVRLTAAPAQHFSGRGLFDRNRTLWASWILESSHASGTRKVYFSADSGYFAGFRDIGNRYGPFDLALIENGAWDAMWPGVHMTPEESVQAYLDVRGKVMMPVHNATFDLALHRWREPLDRVRALAQSRGVVLATPRIGQVMTLGDAVPDSPWWLDLQ